MYSLWSVFIVFIHFGLSVTVLLCLLLVILSVAAGFWELYFVPNNIAYWT